MTIEITCIICKKNRLVNTNGMLKTSYEKKHPHCHKCGYNKELSGKTTFKRGHNTWNKGKAAPYYDRSTGYMRIWLHGKRPKLHRVIMENHVGRSLGADELVHHKDFDKLNNDISNLEVMSRRDHMLLHWEARKRV